MELDQYLWWQTGIIYQIYPRSFQDSDGDGIGDLPGIRSRLDYLEWLGVDALWISPIYPSPMRDCGYDISDYSDIHPVFGLMDDFDQLLEEAHRRNIRVILDLVPNHSSDEHPWFRASRKSRSNPKRDWYIWRDPGRDGAPPNNWLSVFGGSAWEWDEATGQYYYHAFLKEQPDLNWRNPEVQRAILDVMRFWLNKGVDGFRVDVMWHLIKDDQFRDNPLNPGYTAEMPPYDQLLPVYSTDQPQVHEIVRMMRRLTDQYPERLLIGEIYLPVHRLVTYYGPENDGAHLPFNFLLMAVPWNGLSVAAVVDEYEATLPAGGWPNWVLGNHDKSRITSRVGPQQARIAAMLLLTLRGTPTVYYGDEIGMPEVPIAPEDSRDVEGLRTPEKNFSRDPARTPMQWDGSAFAGFSKSEPWLPIGSTFRRINVEREQADEDSALHLYRRLILLRQREPSLMVGNYETVYADQQVFAYRRRAGGERGFLVALNLTHGPAVVEFSDPAIAGEIVLSTNRDIEGLRIRSRILLNGDEGLIVALDPPAGQSKDE